MKGAATDSVRVPTQSPKRSFKVGCSRYEDSGSPEESLRLGRSDDFVDHGSESYMGTSLMMLPFILDAEREAEPVNSGMSSEIAQSFPTATPPSMGLTLGADRSRLKPMSRGRHTLRKRSEMRKKSKPPARKLMMGAMIWNNVHFGGSGGDATSQRVSTASKDSLKRKQPRAQAHQESTLAQRVDWMHKLLTLENPLRIKPQLG